MFKFLRNPWEKFKGFIWSPSNWNTSHFPFRLEYYAPSCRVQQDGFGIKETDWYEAIMDIVEVHLVAWSILHCIFDSVVDYYEGSVQLIETFISKFEVGHIVTRTLSQTPYFLILSINFIKRLILWSQNYYNGDGAFRIGFDSIINIP